MEMDDLYAREERCQKAMRTLRKAIFMRVFVMAVLLWAVLKAHMELWAVGLLILVMVINITGLLPILSEWKKRRQEWKNLIAMEE